MIKRKEEIQIRTVKNAQGGNGEVFFHDWLTKEEACGLGRVFAKLVIPAGSSIGVHQHVGEFEAFYVLSGQATVTDKGQVVVLNPGDMNLCRDGEFHGVENCGDEELVLLALIMDVPKTPEHDESNGSIF